MHVCMFAFVCACMSVCTESSESRPDSVQCGLPVAHQVIYSASGMDRPPREPTGSYIARAHTHTCTPVQCVRVCVCV